MTRIDSTTALERLYRDHIPLAHAMDLSVAEFESDRLTLRAPLAPNINDKGCAFGGSLASLMTLAGWGLINLRLDAIGADCDVYVQDSEIRYLAPVWTDFQAIAQLAPDDWPAFASALEQRGRGRISVTCAVPGDGARPAATLTARFVAVRRTPAPTLAGAAQTAQTEA